MAGKYGSLGRRLRALRSDLWPATFDDVEAVLGTALPASARRCPAWWSNDGSHAQASAWMNAGWRTRGVDIRRGTVVFRREGDPPASAASRSRRGARRYVEEPLSKRGGDTTPAPVERRFRKFARIVPEAGADGRPREFMPQGRYEKAGQKPLNRNGHGPFCRFPEPELPTAPGVYAVVVDGRSVAYVGMAEDLRQRWRGYARIQPANCYRGGQSTNCKINNAILRVTREGRTVDLWIRETAEPGPLESIPIREFRPPWNDRS